MELAPWTLKITFASSLNLHHSPTLIIHLSAYHFQVHVQFPRWSCPHQGTLHGIYLKPQHSAIVNLILNVFCSLVSCSIQSLSLLHPLFSSPHLTPVLPSSLYPVPPFFRAFFLLIRHPLLQSHSLPSLWYLLSFVCFVFFWYVFIHLDSDPPPIHPPSFILWICYHSTSDIPESSQSKCVWHPYTITTAVISIALREQWNVYICACGCVCVCFYFVPRTSNCVFADYTDSGGGTKDDPFTWGTDKTTLGWLPHCRRNLCVCVRVCVHISPI